MKLPKYLQQLSDLCPKWLLNFHPEDAFDRHSFFNSRVVYYPGSGTDGHAVKCFGSTHSAHCFVYADYMVEQSRIEAELLHSSPQNSRCFLGYHSLARIQLAENDLTPDGWKSQGDSMHKPLQTPRVTPYGFLEVLERDDNLNDTHGAYRLAILFLGADGIATYDALFCQQKGISPFAAFIQDHGFGGNDDKFGGGGMLEKLAAQDNVFPRFLMVAENSKPWAGYLRVADVDGELGGMHGNMRCLHEFQD